MGGFECARARIGGEGGRERRRKRAGEVREGSRAGKAGRERASESASEQRRDGGRGKGGFTNAVEYEHDGEGVDDRDEGPCQRRDDLPTRAQNIIYYILYIIITTISRTAPAA